VIFGNGVEINRKKDILFYNAPNDFECIWSKEMVSSLTKDTGSKKAVEKLFKYTGAKVL
jgi:hypothetical protein